MSYAEGTTVSMERSQMEIAAMIRKYGAQSFGTGWDAGHALVTFNAQNRQIRFVLPIAEDWRQFILTKSSRPQRRTEAGAKQAMEKENMRRWRALALAIKAKLEVVETGIASFEHEFGMNIVLPDGTTVAEHVLREVAVAYELGRPPVSMLQLESGDSR
jgi:hypothetical protein